MNMLFEVEDLAVASPATVSRVGTIYMEPEKVVGVRAQIDSYLLSLPAEVAHLKERIDELLSELLPEMVEFSRKRTKEYVASVENSLVMSALNVLTTFWTQFIPIDGVYELPEGLLEKLPKCLDKFVLFAIVWGACATSDNASRKKIDLHLLEQLGELGLAESAGLPEEGLCFDFAISVKDASWVGWMTTVPEFKLSPRPPSPTSSCPRSTRCATCGSSSRWSCTTSTSLRRADGHGKTLSVATS